MKLHLIYNPLPKHRNRARIDLNTQTAVVYRPGQRSFSEGIPGVKLKNSIKPDLSSNAIPVTKELKLKAGNNRTEIERAQSFN